MVDTYQQGIGLNVREMKVLPLLIGLNYIKLLIEAPNLNDPLDSPEDLDDQMGCVTEFICHQLEKWRET